MLRIVLSVGLILALSAGASAATTQEREVETNSRPIAADEQLARLDEVVVSGDQPGPGMWQVQRGDHTLWILGTLSPVPKRMRWKSSEVEALIARAGQVIEPPDLSASSDLGTFRTMFLVPAALRARNNPDDQRLVDIVPPDVYSRWLPLRDKYLGRGRAIEKRRPIIAASDLYRKAIRRSGLERRSPVAAVVRKAAKRHKVEIVEPKVTIKIADPKAMLQEFAASGLDDLDCFARTLARLEIELSQMQARANAWAVGDIEALRELPSQDQAQACIAAVLGASALQSRGFDDISVRLRAAWLEAAEQALAHHATSFATLPMSRLLADDGYLSALQARGYVVVAPE